jgi:hypothetical protein
VDEYRHKIGYSTCKPSPLEDISERLKLSTTKLGGMWTFSPPRSGR